MVMNKLFVSFIFACSLLLKVTAQNDSVYTGKPETPRPKPKENPNALKWRERLVFGGNFGLLFGPITFIDVSPLVGVKVTSKFVVSAGVIYNYYREQSRNFSYSTNLYGVRTQAQYFIVPTLFAQVGYDLINRNNPFSRDPNSRVNVENYWVGGGYRYSIGQRAALQMSVLYNLNQTRLSPYVNPNVFIGFVGGF